MENFSTFRVRPSFLVEKQWLSSFETADDGKTDVITDNLVCGNCWEQATKI